MWLAILCRRLQREEGQDLTEYALLIALIVIAAVAALRLFGTSITGVLDGIATVLAGALGGVT